MGKAVIQEVIKLSPTAKALRLKTKKRINFKPGQFVTLTLNMNNQKFKILDNKSRIQKRIFSLSSTPNKNYLELTIKKTENGFVSNYLVDHIKPNEHVEISPPAGFFYLDLKKSNPNIIFLAAGSGIAPIISMIRYLNESHSKINSHLFYSSRTKEDILWKKEIENISKNNKNFTHHFHLTKDKSRISKQELKRYLKNKDLKRIDCYLCGPLEFVMSMKKMLLDLGINSKNIKSENYK